MFGLGTEVIRLIPVDEQLRMDTTALRNQIQEDIEAGDLPFLMIAGRIIGEKERGVAMSARKMTT